ncbi:M48 family metalloprotease [Streptomyces coacervatus]|uniref:M48 family metalloprotease n=1 Tax=Streptomyces coacervatus TaxID=647381 RepID=A0ABP7JRJ6_9ACTN|nr:M56 family metallopeptidase [Streptomyces coacervatus]MDF2263914.1 M56 family metallopeptidase [Streptomyces coacervatus]
MIYAVWLPLLVPFLAVPVARRGAEHLPPRTAARVLTALSLVLALSSTAALGMLALAGALRMSVVAEAAHLSPHLLGDGSPATVPAALLAALALTVLGVLVLDRTCRHLRELRAAHRQSGSGASAGDLCVRHDDRPDAYALPGRPGRIVVTTGMLRALSAGEREVLFAHERAHLASRHHVFLAAAELAVALHPALRGLRAPLSYALERWADESAAQATGDRALTARAVGRAALAARATGPSARPRLSLTATAGPVPRRVTALLTTPVPAARRLPRALACLLLACVAVSATAVLDAATDLHAGIEIAQGEQGPAAGGR